MQVVKLSPVDKGTQKLAFTAAFASAWPGEYVEGLGLLDVIAVESVCCFHPGLHCSDIRTRKRNIRTDRCPGRCVVPGCAHVCALRAGHSEKVQHYCGEERCMHQCSVPFCNRFCSNHHWHSLEGAQGGSDGDGGASGCHVAPLVHRYKGAHGVLHDCGHDDHTCDRLRQGKCAACGEACHHSSATPHNRHACRQSHARPCVFQCWIPGCEQACASPDHFHGFTESGNVDEGVVHYCGMQHMCNNKCSEAHTMCLASDRLARLMAQRRLIRSFPESTTACGCRNLMPSVAATLQTLPSPDPKQRSHGKEMWPRARQ